MERVSEARRKAEGIVLNMMRRRRATHHATVMKLGSPHIWLHASFAHHELEPDLLDILVTAYPTGHLSVGRERPVGRPDIAVCYDLDTRELQLLLGRAEFMVLVFQESLGRAVFFEPPRMRPREVAMNLQSMASREEATAAMLDVIDLLLEPREAEVQLETPTPVVLVDTYSHYQELLREMAADEQRLLQLTPYKFEEFFAHLLTRDGLEVIHTKPSRDGGVDVLAYRKEQFGKILYAYECKRYDPSNPVGVGVVRKLAGTVLIREAKAGVILTTSRFTGPALEEAELSKIIYPQNGQDLRTWMQRVRDGGTS